MLRLVELFEKNPFHNLSIVVGGALYYGRASLDEEAECLVFDSVGIFLGGRSIARGSNVHVPLHHIQSWHEGGFDISVPGEPKLRVTL